MSFFKPAAKRSPPPAPVVPEVPAVETPLTVEALGQQLKEVLPTRRLQSVSLCDHEANVLWLSEGALGPDEHSLVTEALMLLTADLSLPSYEIPLEDGRLALFLPVRAPNGTPVGIAMILADRKSIGDDTLERISAAPVRAIMQRLAVLLKPSDAGSGSAASIEVLDLDADAEVISPVAAAPVAPVARPAPPPAAPAPRPVAAQVAQPAPAPKPAPAAARAPIAAPLAVPTPAPSISAQEIDDILEFELTPEDTQGTPTLRGDSHPFAAHLRAQAQATESAAAAQGEAADDIEMVALDFEEPAAPSGPAARAPAPAAAPAPAPAARPAVAAMKPAIPTLAPVARPTPIAPRPAPPVAKPAAAPARARPCTDRPARSCRCACGAGTCPGHGRTTATGCR